MSSTTDFYEGLDESMSDEILGEILGYEENYLSDQFRKTFRTRYIDKYQKFLAWKCFRSVLSVDDKLSCHGSTGSLTYSRCK